MITRRLTMRALAFAPLVARKASDLIRQGTTGSGGTPSISGYGVPVGNDPAALGNAPMVPRHTAFQMAMKVPALRTAAYEQAWRQNRNVYNVDPDIEVYRSFSPMAKVTFQRQRNVERAVWQEAEPQQHEAVRPIIGLVNKYMWGRG